MGVPRPEGQPPLGIGEVDGPYHLALRRALTPFFSSGAVEKMRPFMEQSVHWFLDQRIADGEMDLVLDYASPVPAILTMRLMGLPHDNWQLYANLFHSVMDASGGDEYNEVIAEGPAMVDRRLKFHAARRMDTAGRQPAHRHSLEPHRRGRRHHNVTDRTEPSSPRHPPGSAPTAHRPP
jgi:cytochrome P450